MLAVDLAVHGSRVSAASWHSECHVYEHRHSTVVCNHRQTHFYITPYHQKQVTIYGSARITFIPKVLSKNKMHNYTTTTTTASTTYYFFQFLFIGDCCSRFLQAWCHYCCPTDGVTALKKRRWTEQSSTSIPLYQWPSPSLHVLHNWCPHFERRAWLCPSRLYVSIHISASLQLSSWKLSILFVCLLMAHRTLFQTF